MNPLHSLSRAQRGVSLLEVLVTIVVLSLGLLGVSSLHVNGMKNSYSAFLRAQAAQYAYDMTDRMRANRAAAVAGSYNLAMDAGAPAGNTLVDLDRAEWLAQLQGLPGGDGSINVTNAGVATVTVQWSEVAMGGNNNVSITVETVL